MTREKSNSFSFKLTFLKKDNPPLLEYHCTLKKKVKKKEDKEKKMGEKLQAKKINKKKGEKNLSKTFRKQYYLFNRQVKKG
jgi:hypothetical protein